MTIWSIITISQIDHMVNIYLQQWKLLENGGCNDLLRDSAALSVVCFLEMEDVYKRQSQIGVNVEIILLGVSEIVRLDVYKRQIQA